MRRRFHESGPAVVLHLDLAPDADHEAEALPWLDGLEQERRRRFVHPRPRRQFTLCRAALRQLLCAELGCSNDELSFGASVRGKPFALVGGLPARVSFSVSHSGEHGLIATTPEGRIGVDVEERSARRDMEGDIPLLFAPGEQTELAAAGGARKVELFYSLWTMKEALLKAAGLGLALDTTSFEIPLPMCRGARKCLLRIPPMPAVEWRLENLGDSRFAAALARETLAGRDGERGRGLRAP